MEPILEQDYAWVLEYCSEETIDIIRGELVWERRKHLFMLRKSAATIIPRLSNPTFQLAVDFL
jgi:hypothetical protein